MDLLVASFQDEWANLVRLLPKLLMALVAFVALSWGGRAATRALLQVLRRSQVPEIHLGFFRNVMRWTFVLLGRCGGAQHPRPERRCGQPGGRRGCHRDRRRIRVSRRGRELPRGFVPRDGPLVQGGRHHRLGRLRGHGPGNRAAAHAAPHARRPGRPSSRASRSSPSRSSTTRWTVFVASRSVSGSTIETTSRRARALLLRAVVESGLVLEEPAPMVTIAELASSCVMLQVVVLDRHVQAGRPGSLGTHRAHESLPRADPRARLHGQRRGHDRHRLR